MDDEVVFAATPKQIAADVAKLHALVARLKGQPVGDGISNGEGEEDDEKKSDTLGQTDGVNFRCNSDDSGPASLILCLLEPYQEAPQALDVHLGPIASKVMCELERFVLALSVEITRGIGKSGNAEVSGVGGLLEPGSVLLRQLHDVSRVVYGLAKMRGERAVERFFPHEVKHLEPALLVAEWLARGKEGPEVVSVSDAQWETKYVMLLWLGVLVLIPFDMESVDSGQGVGGGLIARIVTACRQFLDDSGRSRDAAAGLVARALTRPDAGQAHLAEFMTWALGEIRFLTSSDAQASFASGFQVLGLMAALAAIFARAKRRDVLPLIPRLLDDLRQLHAKTTAQRKLFQKLVQRIGLAELKPQLAPWRYERGKRALMPGYKQQQQQQQPDRQQQGSFDGADFASKQTETDDGNVPNEVEDVIEYLLTGLRDSDTVVRWSAAKGIGRITSRLPQALADDVVESLLELFSAGEGDGAWHGGCLALAELARRGLLLPSRLNAVVPLIQRALVFDERRGQTFSVGAHVRDAACYVCWAFARAYSPEIMAAHVDSLASTLTIVASLDREVNVRRAAAAAFQESVGRQGSYPHGIAIVTAADFFTVSNITRTYTDVALRIGRLDEIYRHPLIEHLVEYKLVHWSRTLRELAAASLGAFAQLDPKYLRDQGVLTTCVLRCTDPKTAVDARHGYLCAVGEIIRCVYRLVVMGELSFVSTASFEGDPTILPIVGADDRASTLTEWLGESLSTSVTSIIPTLDRDRLFRGRGGEHVRFAACRLIAAVAETRLPLVHSVPQPASNSTSTALRQLPRKEKPTISLYQAMLEENLRQPNEEIQTETVKAMRIFSRNCYSLDPVKPAALELVRNYAHAVSAAQQPSPNITMKQEPSNAAARRGACLALGAMPFQLLGPLKETVIGALIAAMTPEISADDRDAETRRNAAFGLRDIVCECGLDDTTAPAALSIAEFRGIFKAMLAGTVDYCTDNRGDVGSWVREASIIALVAILKRGIDADRAKIRENAFVDDRMAVELVNALLQQSCDKLDRLRGIAGPLFLEVIHEEKLPRIADVVQLRELFPKDIMLDSKTPLSNTQSRTWTKHEATQPLFVNILALSAYRHAVLRGLIHSISGISQTLIIDGSTVLVRWSKQQAHQPEVIAMVSACIDLLEANCARDTVAVLKVLAHLLSHGVFDRLGEDIGLLGMRLVEGTKAAIRGTKDIMRLMAAGHVCSLLLMLDLPNVRRSCFTVLLFLLGHRFPKVRKSTADNFFSRILVDDTCIPSNVLDSCSTLLSTTKWDGPLEHVELARTQLYDALGMQRPASRTVPVVSADAT